MTLGNLPLSPQGMQSQSNVKETDLFKGNAGILRESDNNNYSNSCSSVCLLKSILMTPENTSSSRNDQPMLVLQQGNNLSTIHCYRNSLTHVMWHFRNWGTASKRCLWRSWLQNGPDCLRARSLQRTAVAEATNVAQKLKGTLQMLLSYRRRGVCVPHLVPQPTQSGRWAFLAYWNVGILAPCSRKQTVPSNVPKQPSASISSCRPPNPHRRW